MALDRNWSEVGNGSPDWRNGLRMKCDTCNKEPEKAPKGYYIDQGRWKNLGCKRNGCGGQLFLR